MTEGDGLECRAIGLMGISSGDGSDYRTMRLEGLVMGAPVLILIDSGASHNFVSPQVVAALDLKIDHSRKLSVRLGDEHCIFTAGKCLSIPLKLGGINVTIDAYILELGGVDIILGVEWLQALGKIVVDYREMSMSFSLQGKPVVLMGIGQKTSH